jgi:tRNA1Val (adenine37-N6)-methyltransferase
MLEEKKSTGQSFTFKHFRIDQDQCTMKVGTDGVLLGAWADVSDAKMLLDIGTGTGLIAIMLAQRTQNNQNPDTNGTEGVKVHAVEIDPTAANQAKENMDMSPFSERLGSVNDSIQSFSKSVTHQYDLIVSNPPFFSGGTFSSNQDKTNVRHTVKLSHGDLLQATRLLLAKDGKFCVILPLLEGLRFIDIAKTYGFYCTKKTEVFTLADKAVERLLLQFELASKEMETETLIMLNSQKRNDYTEAYKELTKDFYTIF